MGTKDRDLVQNIEEEGIAGVGVSTEVGDIGMELFGQARVFDKHKASVIQRCQER